MLTGKLGMGDMGTLYHPHNSSINLKPFQNIKFILKRAKMNNVLGNIYTDTPQEESGMNTIGCFI